MIHVPISIGELVDKITILQIKKENIEDVGRLKNVEKEYAVLTSLPEYINVRPQIEEEFQELIDINSKLWKLEDDIRKCEYEENFGDKFIRTARLIYKTNDERSRVKKQINLKLKSELIEEKSYEDYL